MEKQIKTIGVLTSGGDAPGMNAAVRAVVRAGLHKGFRMIGIQRGYNGLLDGECFEMNLRSVSNIISAGGTILYKAHQMLEMITLDRDTAHYKKLVAEKYGELVYNGLWFSPLREALDAFVNKTQETVTGDVKLKLYKGNVMNAGITSPYTLYDETVASFGDDGGAYNQKDSAGFINLFGLPLKVKALLDQKREANED